MDERMTPGLVVKVAGFMLGTEISNIRRAGDGWTGNQFSTCFISSFFGSIKWKYLRGCWGCALEFLVCGSLANLSFFIQKILCLFNIKL